MKTRRIPEAENGGISAVALLSVLYWLLFFGLKVKMMKI
jgi:hypothetical protein